MMGIELPHKFFLRKVVANISPNQQRASSMTIYHLPPFYGRGTGVGVAPTIFKKITPLPTTRSRRMLPSWSSDYNDGRSSPPAHPPPEPPPVPRGTSRPPKKAAPLPNSPSPGAAANDPQQRRNKSPARRCLRSSSSLKRTMPLSSGERTFRQLPLVGKKPRKPPP
jgi:hypothetical protein